MKVQWKSTHVVALSVTIVCFASECALCAEQVLPSYKIVDGVSWKVVDDDQGRTIVYHDDEPKTSKKRNLVVPSMRKALTKSTSKRICVQ